MAPISPWPTIVRPVITGITTIRRTPVTVVTSQIIIKPPIRITRTLDSPRIVRSATTRMAGSRRRSITTVSGPWREHMRRSTATAATRGTTTIPRTPVPAVILRITTTARIRTTIILDFPPIVHYAIRQIRTGYRRPSPSMMISGH